MTEETTETELSDFDKQQLAEQERAARNWIRIEQEEASKRKEADDWARIGTMGATEFEAFRLAQEQRPKKARQE